MMISKMIVLNFGAFVPGKGSEAAGKMHLKPMTGASCKGFQCKGRCIGPADETWAQAVGSAVLRVVMQGIRSRDSLIHLLGGFFEKLSENSWEALNIDQIWNLKKPIWFQSIVHLIEPHLVPALVPPHLT